MEPTRYDIVVKKGEDWEQPITVEDADLTGATAAAQIRKRAGDETLTQAITCVIDADAGTVTMSLTRAETAAITAGSYVYDLRLDIDGKRKFPIQGKFEVWESVTV